MKIVRVQYTTTPDYVDTNKKNIRKIIEELEKIKHPGIMYRSYLLQDGKTFMHLDQFENEEAHQFLQSLESFKKFSSELLASNIEIEPKLDLLSLVTSTKNFL